MAALGTNHDSVSVEIIVPKWEQDGWNAVHASSAKIITMADMFL